MCALIASARSSYCEALPQEAVHNRSTALMGKLDKLEHRYVENWKTRIDLEVTSQDAMSKHVNQAQWQHDMARNRFHSRNELWAGRAQAASHWRGYLGERKLERTSSCSETKQRRMVDFDAWKDRVLVDAPRQELERRNTWLSTAQCDSMALVDNHHRRQMGLDATGNHAATRGKSGLLRQH
mmetsp:Transcript_12349/g.19576  ORF Transcript_12349/g.19576 Transcript_12349/m.19576 type:complete len:182 (+) Transcript_12349:71-616(+)